jgi:hypothetical protein
LGSFVIDSKTLAIDKHNFTIQILFIEFENPTIANYKIAIAID